MEVAERWVTAALTAVKDIELPEGIHGEVMCRNAMLAAIGRRVPGMPDALACSAVDTAIENLFNA